MFIRLLIVPCTDKHRQERLESTECTYVAHLRNLIYNRVPQNHAPQYQRNATDWMWTVAEQA